MVDIKAEHAAVDIEINVQPVQDLARLRARSGLKFNIEAVGFGIVLKLRDWPFRNLRSKKALWIVSGTTRRTRGASPPLRKEILHISIAQSEPGVEPNGVSNDVRWKAVTFEGDGVHPKRLH